jgi:hypothetical protein
VQKHNRQLLFELIRPPVLLVGFAVKTIYRAMFGWWLDPWVQRQANQSLIEDVRANLPFLFPNGSVVEHRQIRVLPFDYASVEIRWEDLLFSNLSTPSSPAGIHTQTRWETAAVRSARYP